MNYERNHMREKPPNGVFKVGSEIALGLKDELSRDNDLWGKRTNKIINCY